MVVKSTFESPQVFGEILDSRKRIDKIHERRAAMSVAEIID